MNSTSPMWINPNMIFVIVAVLIVLAMLMGGKNRTTRRTSFGWWIGLGVLLFIGSGFIFFARSGSGSNFEVRHSVRSAINEVKNQIRVGVETGREALDQGREEVSKSIEQIQGAFGSQGSSTTKTKGKKKPDAAASVVGKSTSPTGNVSWTVEVKEKDRKQKKEDVEKLLQSKATVSVNRWVADRMPVRNFFLNAVTTPWLQERGAFSEPIDYQTEEVPRANTSETDQLYSGTMKVVLTPSVQESLLDMGYDQLNEVLKSDQFQAQWIVSLVLMGITIFVGILGLVKTVVFRRATGYAAQPIT